MDFIFKQRYLIDDLLKIMSVLRSEDGCPWDREQTHESMRKNFIEETYEVCEAIDKNDIELLREELGDVLLQVVFHSKMEEEKGEFNFDDVVNDICQKLIVRHPHVFSDTAVTGVSDVLDNWNAIKQKIKGQELAAETLYSVPKQLPALMRAQKLQGRAKKANAAFGYKSKDSVFTDLKSEISELEIELNNGDMQNIAEELGDVMFACANIARFLDFDAEELLTASSNKFVERVAAVERMAIESNVDFESADETTVDIYWKAVKEK